MTKVNHSTVLLDASPNAVATCCSSFCRRQPVRYPAGKRGRLPNAGNGGGEYTGAQSAVRGVSSSAAGLDLRGEFAQLLCDGRRILAAPEFNHTVMSLAELEP